MEDMEAVRALAGMVKGAGGRLLLVGGAVRDMYLGVGPKDFDCEVYGVAANLLEKLLSGFGTVNKVGAAFSVYKVGNLDVSLPRRDSKVGDGHKGFEVTGDPSMSPREAARRRDFTMNSMAFDPLTGETLDYFCGRADLDAKVLRVTDPETFTEDPLRVWRAVQFVARFGLSVEPESFKLMKGMV